MSATLGNFFFLGWHAPTNTHKMLNRECQTFNLELSKKPQSTAPGASLVIAALEAPVPSAQTPNQPNRFGERIRDIPASDSATPPPLTPTPNAPPDTCRTCGKKPFPGFDRCFFCLQQAAPHEFKKLVDDTWTGARQALQNLKDPRLTQTVIDKLLAAKRHFQDHRTPDPDEQKRMNRQALDQLGDTPIGPSGKKLREHAAETVKQLLPALEGTDYAEDPIKSLSYMLILDGKGFLTELRLIRGPLGNQMTIMEAYEYYTRTDPAKARDMLEMIDNVRKLSQPDSTEKPMPLILDTLGRTLRLLQK
jgi:hypothetical protein